MVLSEPRSLAQFMDQLKIVRTVWDIKEGVQQDGQGSGQILRAEIVPTLWVVTFDLANETFAAGRQTRALLNSLAPVGRHALIYDPLAEFPAYDPDGTILGANTVTLHTVGTSRDTLRLNGLPSAYQLRPGDKIEIGYASGTRRQIVEVSELGTASGAGLTPAFAVYPHLRPGIAVGAATINLKRPALKMLRLTHSPGAKELSHHGGMSVSFIEKVA